MLLILYYLIVFEWDLIKKLGDSVIFKITRIEGYGFSIVLDNRKERTLSSQDIKNIIIQKLHEFKGKKVHIRELTELTNQNYKEEDVVNNALTILDLQNSGIVEMRVTLKNGNLKDMEIQDVIVRSK